MKKSLLLLALVSSLSFADEKYVVVESIKNIQYMEVPTEFCQQVGHSRSCSFGYNKVPIPAEGYIVKIKSLEREHTSAFKSDKELQIGSLVIVKD